jgi:hypothetical protein
MLQGVMHTRPQNTLDAFELTALVEKHAVVAFELIILTAWRRLGMHAHMPRLVLPPLLAPVWPML